MRKTFQARNKTEVISQTQEKMAETEREINNMAIYKRNSEHYWYGFIWNGKRIQRSTKQGDKETAKLLEAAERTRLARQDAGIESRSVAPLFKTFALEWLEGIR